MPELASDLGVQKLVFSAFVESGNGEKNVDEFGMNYNRLQDILEDIARDEFSRYRILLTNYFVYYNTIRLRIHT